MVDINTYAKFVDTTTSGEEVEKLSTFKTDSAVRQLTWRSTLESVDDFKHWYAHESGEFAEVMKKILFQGKEFNEENRFHMKREWVTSFGIGVRAVYGTRVYARRSNCRKH